MKKSINYFLICFFVYHTAYGQDSFKIQVGLNAGFAPHNVVGTYDTGSGYQENGGNKYIVAYPIYKKVDSTHIYGNGTVLLNVTLPIIKKENWSLGVGVNVETGYQTDLHPNASEFFLRVSDYPVYGYYRNFKNNFEYSVLLGYKYTKTFYAYHLIFAGFDFHVGERHTIRLYSSINNYKYYIAYSNGEIEPYLKISQFGISWIGSLTN